MGQANVGGWVQLPAPLHAPAEVSEPAVQVGPVPQLIPDPGNWQLADWPSHTGAHAPLPVHAVRAGVPPVRGAPLTRRQVPSEPLSLHDEHWSVHASLQHTPSAQCPLVH